MADSVLAQTLVLPCGAQLKNRIAKAAMTEGMASPWGSPTTRHAQLYRRWSEGGAALLITGNVMIDRRYLERPGNVCVEDESDLGALRAWTKAGTAEGNHIWAQISHPGRQATRFSSSNPVAPSAVQFQMLGLFAKPRALTDLEVAGMPDRYARSARIAQKGGFSGVQIHAAHGYLLSQFLSPAVNQRTDRWGGVLENRARLLLETVRAVREAVGPDFPVAVKLNSADFQKGGFSLEESAQVASWLEHEGIDLLEISGGTYEQFGFVAFSNKKGPKIDALPKAESTKRREAFFLEYAKTIRGACSKTPLMVTGGFRSRAFMEEAIGNEELEMIGIGRPFCVNPDAATQLIDGTIEELDSPEHRLELGPGAMGRAATNRTLRGLNAAGEVFWFYRQMLQLADGKPLRSDLSMAKALAEHYAEEGRIALARRREFQTRGVPL